MIEWIPADLPVTVALQIIILLLPGFLALRIRDGIAETSKRESKEAWLPALLFDLPIYLLLLVVSRIPQFALTPTLTEGGFNPMTLLAVLMIASAVGVVAGLVDEKRWIRTLMIKLGISRKGWRNAWADSFRQAKKCWAIVYLKDGTRVFGWPQFYSADDKEPTIFLAAGKRGGEPVTIIPPGATYQIPIRGPGVLLVPSAGVTRLEFLEGVERPPDSG